MLWPWLCAWKNIPRSIILIFQNLALIRGWVPNKSSPLEVSCKKGVLKNFVKFTGKHVCRSLFFNKVAGIKPAVTLLKKRLRHWRFPVNFANFLRTPFSVEHLWWLLLSVVMSRSFIFWEKSLFSNRKLKLQWQMLIWPNSQLVISWQVRVNCVA